MLVSPAVLLKLNKLSNIKNQIKYKRENKQEKEDSKKYQGMRDGQFLINCPTKYSDCHDECGRIVKKLYF